MVPSVLTNWCGPVFVYIVTGAHLDFSTVCAVENYSPTLETSLEPISI
jgi:hypothetical protein